jgi:hypothetical protein
VEEEVVVDQLTPMLRLVMILVYLVQEAHGLAELVGVVALIKLVLLVVVQVVIVVLPTELVQQTPLQTK